MENNIDIQVSYDCDLDNEMFNDFKLLMDQSESSIKIEKREEPEFHNFSGDDISNIVIYISENKTALIVGSLVIPAFYDLLKEGIKMLWKGLVKSKELGDSKSISLKYTLIKKRNIEFTLCGNINEKQIESLIDKSFEIMKKEQKESLFKDKDLIIINSNEEKVSLNPDPSGNIWKAFNKKESQKEMERIIQLAENYIDVPGKSNCSPKKDLTSYCLSCERETNHKIIHKHKVITDDITIKETIYGVNIYMIVECLGCNKPSFCLYEKESDVPIVEPINYNEEDPDDISFISSYPSSPNIEDGFLITDFQYSLPRQLDELYEELRNAFNTPTTVLAGIGLRTLVEAICIDQKIKGDNLKKKIENLHKAGLISNNEIPILDKLRLIGNVSAHEIKTIDIEYLDYALGIVNHVLMSIYILPDINKKLEKALKPKPKKS